MTDTATAESTPQEAQEPAQDAVEPKPGQGDQNAPEAPENGTQEPEVEAEDAKPSEAKLRKRAQAAETERDEVRGQLDALRRQVVAGTIEATGVKAAGVLATVEDIGTLFAEDGSLDGAALKTAIDSATEAFGLAHPVKAPKPNPAQGSSGSQSEQRQKGSSFADAFRR